MESSAEEGSDDVNKTISIAGNLGAGKDTIASWLIRQNGYVPVGFADALKRTTAQLFNLDDGCFWGESDERNRPWATPISIEYVRIIQASVRNGYHRELLPLFQHRVTLEDAAKQLYEALAPHAPITTPRRLLQLIGHEFGRALWDEVWLNAVNTTRQAVAVGVPYFRRDGLQLGLKTRLPPAAIVIPDCRYPNEAQYVVEQLGGSLFWVDASKRVPPDPAFAHSSESTREPLAKYITWDIDNNGTPEELEHTLRTQAAQFL